MHPEFRNELARLFIFDVLGNRFEFHHLCNLRDGRDHRFRNPVFGDVADEPAVDLEGVDCKVLEVGE